MQVDNDYSNWEGWDDEDCFAWGEYFGGRDPLYPWRCLLCKSHMVSQRASGFARHFRLIHGIKVVVPPTSAGKEEGTGLKRSASDAGLDDGGEVREADVGEEEVGEELVMEDALVRWTGVGSAEEQEDAEMEEE